MNVSPSKENILKKIRKALTQSTPLPFSGSEGNNSVFHPVKQDLEVEFAEEFARLLGRFAFCLDTDELQESIGALTKQKKWLKIFCNEENLKQILPGWMKDFYTDDLENCDLAITSCECLIARTGSIVMSAAQAGGRTVSVYAPVHICIAYTDQLVPDIREGLNLLKEKYGSTLPSMMTFATGPSRTADIEKTLVVGVHGPKEVYVFLIDKQ